MTKRRAALGLIAAVALAPSAAGATGLSMNEVELPAGTTLDACKSAGRAAIRQAGLQSIGESAASVFGTTAANDLAAIYCLPQRGIAMVAVAGADNQTTRPILGALLRFMTSP